MEDKKIIPLNKVREDKIINQARDLIENLEDIDEEEFDRRLEETLHCWEEHKKMAQENKWQTAGMQQVFTPEEVADYLKVKPKTIREYLKSGKLKGIKVGKQWRIKQKDLEAFLNTGDEE